MTLSQTVKRLALIPYRFAAALRYYADIPGKALCWAFRSRERTNFTYDLDLLNRRYLAAFIAEVTGADAGQIESYFAELENDAALRAHIRRLTEASPQSYVADADARFGRRIGWYALVRAMKPKVVIETGVDKGLGSCVIAAALMRNGAGQHYGTDINPKAGYLLQEPYNRYGKVLYGDSIDTLSKLPATIDLVINDSDHSPDYELREYETVAPKLSATALLVSDNAHCSDRLLRFAQATDRRFLFWQEKPANHWYPGGGIGVAFKS